MWISVAIITVSASRISSSVRTFFVPAEPCISARRVCPMIFAVFSRASAAMTVWAIPVGQAMTATIFAICLLLSRLKDEGYGQLRWQRTCGELRSHHVEGYVLATF